MSMITDETTVFATGQVRSVQTLAVPGVRFVPDRHQVQEAGFAYFAFLDRLARPLLARFGRHRVMLVAGTLRACWPLGLTKKSVTSSSTKPFAKSFWAADSAARKV